MTEIDGKRYMEIEIGFQASGEGLGVLPFIRNRN